MELKGRDSKGRFVKGSSYGKPAGCTHNKKLVAKLKTAVTNAIKQYIKEEEESAMQLSLFLEKQDKETQKGVYILSSNGKYRIGASSNLATRIEAHRAANLTEIQVVSTFVTNTIDEANTIEKALHERLYDNAIGNSWYELSNEQLLNTILYVNSIIYGRK